MGAPTAKLETVVIISPYKVLSLFFTILSLLCLVIAMPSTFWFHADRLIRYGLWQECVVESIQSNNNLELGKSHEQKIQTNFNCILNNKVWVQLCGSFVIVSLSCTVIGIILIITGLKHKRRQERKMKLYGAAGFVAFVGMLCILAALVLFPIMFIREMHERGKDKWFFGWSYGVAWGAFFFLTSAAILLMCDRKREELFYKESLYINNDEDDFLENQDVKIKTLKR